MPRLLFVESVPTPNANNLIITFEILKLALVTMKRHSTRSAADADVRRPRELAFAYEIRKP